MGLIFTEVIYFIYEYFICLEVLATSEIQTVEFVVFWYYDR